jgi:hypothetical protein
VSRPEGAWQLFKPWSGLVAGVVGASIAHQFGSEGTFDNCAAVSPGPLLLVTVMCIAAAIAGGWLSSQVVRDRPSVRTSQLIAIISIGMAALAVFGLLLPMIAALMLPACFQ